MPNAKLEACFAWSETRAKHMSSQDNSLDLYTSTSLKRDLLCVFLTHVLFHVSQPTVLLPP
jgi:hypothetical protein